MKIKDLDINDRPREKLLLRGADSMTTAELLGILMGSGTPEVSVVELSQQMLADSDHKLRRLGQMSVKQMKSYKGIGDAKAVTILAAMELARRYAGERLLEEEVTKITDSVAAYRHMRLRLQDLKHEEFWMVALNNSRIPLADIRVSDGGIAAAPVDVRKLMRLAIEKSATAIIVYHNHPSGAPNPSAQDDTLTRRLVEAARTLDITLLDHIIILPDGFYSYSDHARL